MTRQRADFNISLLPAHCFSGCNQNSKELSACKALFCTFNGQPQSESQSQRCPDATSSAIHVGVDTANQPIGTCIIHTRASRDARSLGRWVVGLAGSAPDFEVAKKRGGKYYSFPHKFWNYWNLLLNFVNNDDGGAGREVGVGVVPAAIEVGTIYQSYLIDDPHCLIIAY